MGRLIKFFEWLVNNPVPQCEQNEALPDIDPYKHKHNVDVSKLKPLPEAEEIKHEHNER